MSSTLLESTASVVREVRDVGIAGAVGGRRSRWGGRWVVSVYGRTRNERIRSWLRRWVMWREGGPGLSLSVREVMRRYHGLEIGLYSLWPFRSKPGVFHPGTSIGRYTRVADSVRTFTRNHPMNTKSTHGFFENPALGRAKADLMTFGRMLIGHGVWVGHNAIILPPTAVIGEGAIVTPGSVVCSNVPPYAVVGGFPARVTGYRFDRPTIAELLELRWWDLNPAELRAKACWLNQRLGQVAVGAD